MLQWLWAHTSTLGQPPAELCLAAQPPAASRPRGPPADAHAALPPQVSASWMAEPWGELRVSQRIIPDPRWVRSGRGDTEGSRWVPEGRGQELGVVRAFLSEEVALVAARRGRGQGGCQQKCLGRGGKKIFRFSAIVARFFPGVFWPEALRERAGGIGHLQRAGGVHRGFWCPKVLQHPQNELAEP